MHRDTVWVPFNFCQAAPLVWKRSPKAKTKVFRGFKDRGDGVQKVCPPNQMERSQEEDIRELIRILHLALSVKRREYAGEAEMQGNQLKITKLYPDTDAPFLLEDLLFNLIFLNSDKSDIESIHNSYSVKITETEPKRFLFGTKNL